MISKVTRFALISAFPGYVGASYLYKHIRKTEKYKVIEDHNSFEERSYDSVLYTEISLQASSYMEAYRRGVEQLDGYIGGGNSRMKRIPILYPVYTYIFDGEDRKKGALILIKDKLRPDKNAAIYRINYPFNDRVSRSLIGKPNNPYIQLKQSPDQTLIARKFWGYMTEGNIKKNVEKLRLDGSQKGYILGSYRIASYDPWWIFYPLRRNEIIGEYTKVEKAEEQTTM